jgi:hypothetical protein
MSRMNDDEDDDEITIGHSSTTAPGGEKDLTGDPGRTPGKAEGDEQTADEDLRRQAGK